MDGKIKILVSGDVNGNLNTLFSRTDTLNKKAGPFEMLLCVGNFFGNKNCPELTNYKNGTKTTTVPTYILGPMCEDQELFYNDMNGCEIAPNIHYLGKRGLYSPSSGLKIAYLSGLENDTDKNNYSFNKSDAITLKNVCVRNQNFRGVDILLTSQWPSGVTNSDESFKSKYNGSNIISWLAVHLKPRYHIAGSEGLYFERKPYRNSSKSDDSMELATRFLALASVNNTDKQKWLYALSLTPVENMRMTDLYQRTTDETISPYPNDLLQDDYLAQNKNKQVQFFYDMDAPQEDDGRNKRKSKDDPFKRKRVKPEFDQSKCWFCLGSPKVEKHLVISIGDLSYLALAKGGLVDEHLLILPIAHHQATIGLPNDCLDEINKFKIALCKYFKNTNQIPVFFERNYKTSHLQIQVVPVPQKVVKNVKNKFVEMASEYNFQLETLDPSKSLNDILQVGVPYFTVDILNETLYTERVGSNFPLQFGREVLAAPELLNMNDRIEWQNCILDERIETENAHKFRDLFELYDFTV